MSTNPHGQSEVAVTLTPDEATAALIALERYRLAGWTSPYAAHGATAEEKLAAIVRKFNNHAIG